MPDALGVPQRIRFVTGNAGKVEEMRRVLSGLGVTVDQDRRGYTEIQHPALSGVTEAGALELLQGGLEPPFLLEDSGLFVDGLNGFPGVYSRHALDTIGIAGLLALLAGVETARRRATFRSDLCCVDARGSVHHFEGVCMGRIASAPAGSGGFGFDPVFVPDAQPGGGGAAPLTFAQMAAGDKDRVSHRGQAVRAFRAWLGKAANR